MFGFFKKKKNVESEEEMLARQQLEKLQNSPTLQELRQNADNFSNQFDLADNQSFLNQELQPPVKQSHSEFLSQDDYSNIDPKALPKKIPVFNISKGVTSPTASTNFISSSSPAPSSPISADDQELISFLDNLLTALTGYKIENIPPEKRIEILTSAFEIYSKFILDFVQEKYGQKEAMRLKAAQRYNDSGMFKKFDELPDILQDAYASFVTSLKQQAEA